MKIVLERILDGLAVEGEVSIDEDDEAIIASVEGPELGLLIGKQGQTIDAVQLVCYQAGFQGRRERKRVIVDAAGYRERREAAISRKADAAAEDAVRNGRRVEMEPMSAQERRVVHTHLKDRAGIETFSEGDEPNRFVVIAPLISD